MNSECLHVSDRVLIPNHCLIQAVTIDIDSGCAHIIIPYLVPVGNRTVYIRIVIITVILAIGITFSSNLSVSVISDSRDAVSI